MKKIIVIEGMMCEHCRMNVRRALEAVDGVKEADVDLKSGKAEVTLSENVPDSTLTDAVEKAGYTAVSCGS